ncbi:MAG: bifunctional diaminohydroxyphosphoribosylaminopyrimidine deaminase/5-amino-6-(5-phosphoribosylamino)uracil reductase RibD [Pirellulales bacterium]
MPSASNPTQDESWMQRAIELARRGRGSVEPNPMVGCVIVRHQQILAEGYHQRFGGPHAEIEALHQLGDANLHDATVYVTLEPCCHFGKTPPCVDQLIRCRPERVVIGIQDPFPRVAGGGIQRLREAGIRTEVGVLADEATRLLEPYLKRVQLQLPWVHAKWAMSLDGTIATHTGSSQWISSPESREATLKKRSEMDAIVVGIGTVLADNPRLTARPSGTRIPTRIIFDSKAILPLTSQLIATLPEAPVLVVCGPDASEKNIVALQSHQVEVLQWPSPDPQLRIESTLRELAKRDFTNILIEGGSRLLGAFHDGQWIDEAYVVIAPKIIGGHQAYHPIGGHGISQMSQASMLRDVSFDWIGGDLHLRGRLHRNSKMTSDKSA